MIGEFFVYSTVRPFFLLLPSSFYALAYRDIGTEGKKKKTGPCCTCQRWRYAHSPSSTSRAIR